MPKTKKNRLKLDARSCIQCRAKYTPIRRSQRFCAAPKTCRTAFHNERVKKALELLPKAS